MKEGHLLGNGENESGMEERHLFGGGQAENEEGLGGASSRVERMEGEPLHGGESLDGRRERGERFHGLHGRSRGSLFIGGENGSEWSRVTSSGVEKRRWRL